MRKKAKWNQTTVTRWSPTFFKDTLEKRLFQPRIAQIQIIERNERMWVLNRLESGFLITFFIWEHPRFEIYWREARLIQLSLLIQIIRAIPRVMPQAPMLRGTELYNLVTWFTSGAKILRRGSVDNARWHVGKLAKILLETFIRLLVH